MAILYSLGEFNSAFYLFILYYGIGQNLSSASKRSNPLKTGF
ncbi:hypothetical protein T4B_14606 [Trichinella pseudospiralis]|uniref:Uncharacterized protein n=1 Tax=Trichinella pseudospiralis TaxID=6337 RepID=A0A0V1BZ51_TRIPS|nr:hypothetical protein T4A_10098 [Trichinella pseudospiralis]KRY94256.1 hypothetical protein T4B_14606 [Trichinella pseudospiralis]